MTELNATQETESDIIKRIRESQGLNLRDFASEIGVSHVAVYQWENGKTTIDIDRVIDWLSNDQKWVRDMAVAIMSCKVGPAFKLTLVKPNGEHP